MTDTGGTDGIDTVRNVETLKFTDREIAASSITAPAPAASVSATTLDFGAQDTAATATQVVTVTNTGSASLTVTGATLSGANANQFAVTNGCTTVAPAGSCSITVAFTPTTTGAKRHRCRSPTTRSVPRRSSP